jgi:hypothetical protein
MEPAMWGPGVLVAERFEIEKLAGSGGMGMVFRARDRETGLPVALKLLPPDSRPQDAERLWREAQVLADLRHPGIAAYVAHGRTVEGRNFLAMEWLEGEDLARRLGRQRLTLAECLALVRAVADALATVHRRGFVHRDVKPSNLLLREGRPERVVLLDFGIARGLGRGEATRTDELLGTPQYLSPEQARGERLLSPSVDIFALGCVLYECLVGRAPFTGGHVAMVLMRILSEEVPPLRQIRPELPEGLERLLGHMLTKNPEVRYADGSALLEALGELKVPTELLEGDGAAGAMSTRLLVERQLVSVLLVLPATGVEARSSTEASQEAAAAGGEISRDLAGVLAPFGVRSEALPGGVMVGTLLRAGETARDQAVQAARAALALRARRPTAAVALAMGRSAMVGPRPTDEVLERAFKLARMDLGARAEMKEGALGQGVWLDELTAQLLAGRFLVERVGDEGLVLVEERGEPDPTQLLLGRPTPCVGREQELRLLDMIFEGCVEEPGAQAVLVVAPPGAGKSRLRHEFVRRLEARGLSILTLLGRGDSLQTGAAYGLLGQALRRLCERAGASGADQREQMIEVLGRRLETIERQRVVEFLGELCGWPFSDARSPLLRAARLEPRIMADQVTEAFVTWLRAECAAQPVILVLEDLHWSDTATVRMVDTALRELTDRPLLVLALGRPEVRELFPHLWDGRSLQEIRLPELSRKASERLMREVLGERATPDLVERIVARAGGHALYLEELVRAVAESASEEVPEAILAMMQARFLRLEPGVRRILRAASIFGETFWRGGVQELLKADAQVEQDLDRWLAILVETEVLVRHRQSRLPKDEEFAFRHGLLRDAAYSLLGEEERRIGHQLAAGYLERVGESDPLMLAEHHVRGGAPELAAAHYACAAGRALASSDLAGARRYVEQGVACGATGEVLGILRGIEAWACTWGMDPGRAYEASRAALGLLPEGGAAWYQALGAALGAAGVRGQVDALRELLRTFSAVRPLPGAESAFAEPAMAAALMMTVAGMRQATHSLLDHMDVVYAALGTNEARARAFIQLAKARYTLLMEMDPWGYRSAAAEAMAGFQTAGDQRFFLIAQANVAMGEAELGHPEAAAPLFRASFEPLAALDTPVLAMVVQTLSAVSLARWEESQYRAEARRYAEAVLRSSPLVNFWVGLTHVALAFVELADGALGMAERAALRALEVFVQMPVGRPLGCMALGRVYLRQGRASEARKVTDEGLAQLEALGGRGWMDVSLHLIAAEARRAVGDEAAARAALADACAKIEQRAHRIADPASRERFLTRVPDHVRALEWARTG